jgi:thiamine biosynthesis lipoprotein
MPLEQVRFRALGSSCHLLGVDPEPGRLSWGEAWIASMHDRFSRFLPASELSGFNAAAGRWVDVSPDLEAMLRAALAAFEASGGLVHAGVLGSLLAIGYTRPLSEGPTAATLTAVGPPPPLPETLEVGRGRARLRPGTGVDLGGVAKGWLADRLTADLGGNCLVNLGGDLRARGEGPRGEGWPVGVGGVTLMLREQGAATSGTRRRRWEAEGEDVHHLIDPRTGRPAETDLSEVSVVAETATAAEACAKTALLLGSVNAPLYLAARTLAWWLH